MADFGFWNLATQDPERIALVDPDSGALRAGELLARANRLVHGLRALGLGPGDCLATVLRLPQSEQNVAVVVFGARSNAGRFMESRNLFNWVSSKASTLFAAKPATQQE